MRLICLFVVLLCQSALFISAASYEIIDFGAVSGKFLNTSYIQAAIDSCHRGGGGGSDCSCRRILHRYTLFEI